MALELEDGIKNQFLMVKIAVMEAIAAGMVAIPTLILLKESSNDYRLLILKIVIFSIASFLLSWFFVGYFLRNQKQIRTASEYESRVYSNTYTGAFRTIFYLTFGHTSAMFFVGTILDILKHPIWIVAVPFVVLCIGQSIFFYYKNKGQLSPKTQ